MKTYFLGCDAGKGYCDFTLLNKNKRIIEENFQLDDSYEGHQTLCVFLEDFFSSHEEAIVYAGLESTGGYETNWYQLLWKLQSRLNVQVARVSPYGVKYHKRAGLVGVETDKISARKIAEYLIAYPEKVTFSKEDYFADLRRHWKHIRMLKKQKSQLQTALKAHLYVSHPQLLTYCTEGIALWVLNLLIKYPTAARLAKARVKALSKIPYISEERARVLIKDARRSVASMTSSSMENIIRSAVNQIVNLKKAIGQQEKLMMGTYKFPEIQLLLSFPGISEYSAFGLLLEIAATEWYPTVKNLASFFGLNPRFQDSGDGIGAAHMSKRGRKEPRWILFNVAKSAVCHNEMIKQAYERHLEKGKCKMSALGIMMHKILRIVYGMLKHKTRYNPAIDIANRERTAWGKEITKPRLSINRRYQTYDPKAPISKRQTKKRNQEMVKLGGDAEYAERGRGG